MTASTQKAYKNNIFSTDNFSRDFSPKGSRDSYNPFGKPGAGAPVRDSDGRVKTHILGKVEHETRVCILKAQTHGATLPKQDHFLSCVHSFTVPYMLPWQNLIFNCQMFLQEYSPNTTRNELLAKQSYLKTLRKSFRIKFIICCIFSFWSFIL